MYRSKDNLDDAVVVVNDVAGFNANLGLTGGETDRDIQALRLYGESYYTDQLGNLWDIGQSISYGKGQNGYLGYRLSGKGWNPEVSVNLLSDGKGGMSADWGSFRDWEDPNNNFGANSYNPDKDEIFVHTHPINKGLEKKVGGISWVPVKGHPDGGPRSHADWVQLPDSGLKGRFNIAVSENQFHFYNLKVDFSVDRSFFRY